MTGNIRMRAKIVPPTIMVNQIARIPLSKIPEGISNWVATNKIQTKVLMAKVGKHRNPRDRCMAINSGVKVGDLRPGVPILVGLPKTIAGISSPMPKHRILVLRLSLHKLTIKTTRSKQLAKMLLVKVGMHGTPTRVSVSGVQVGGRNHRDRNFLDPSKLWVLHRMVLKTP